MRTVVAIPLSLLVLEPARTCAVLALVGSDDAMPAAKPIHIVDDDIGFLKGIERVLATYGLDVRAYSSASEFLERAHPDDAACLVLDIHLGSTSGIELMSELFRSGATVPVVLITASDSEHVRRIAMDAGCDAYLQKPVSAAVLLDVIRRVIGERSGLVDGAAHRP